MTIFRGYAIVGDVDEASVTFPSEVEIACADTEFLPDDLSDAYGWLVKALKVARPTGGGGPA